MTRLFGEIKDKIDLGALKDVLLCAAVGVVLLQQRFCIQPADVHTQLRSIYLSIHNNLYSAAA